MTEHRANAPGPRAALAAAAGFVALVLPRGFGTLLIAVVLAAFAPAALWAQPGAVPGAIPDAVLAPARQALAAGRAGDAFTMLDALAPTYAGRIEFDYLLGLSALDSGRPNQAVIALERVLATDPAHGPARAEIGRAYLALREFESARRELEAVARGELPPSVRDTVQRYLDTVVRLGDARRPTWLVQLEAGLGWDSNVNFGSSFGEWVLADGQALVPLPASQPRNSPFAALAAGVTYVAPINGWLDWTAGLQLSQRVNSSQHNMDTGSAEASAGLSTALAPHRYSMSVQLQHLRLDGASFRDAAGAIVQWQWDSGPRTQFGAYAQVFELSFPAEPIRDARRLATGLTLAQGFAGPRTPTLAATLHGGTERPEADVPQLAFDFVGLRTAFGASIAPGWRAQAGWSFERRSFDGVEPLFGTTRVDRQHDLRIGLEHDLDRSWTLAPALAWTRNASTVAPNDFRRTQAFVYARYRF